MRLPKPEYRLVAECPCGNWQVDWVAREVPPVVVEAVMREHFEECIVAQASLVNFFAARGEDVPVPLPPLLG